MWISINTARATKLNDRYCSDCPIVHSIMAKGLVLALNAFLLLIAIAQLTGRPEGVVFENETPVAQFKSVRFAGQHVQAYSMRAAAWLCGSVRPFRFDRVTTISKPADGAWRMDNVQLLGGGNGRYGA
jgi:hypothetical protein